MKKVRISIVSIVSLLIVFFFLAGGCSTFDKTTYQTLTISKTTYDTAMKVAADLHSKGAVTDAQKAEIIRLGKIYKGAHNTVVKSFEAFKQSGTPATEMTYLAQLSVAAAAMVDLLEYVYSLKEVNE